MDAPLGKVKICRIHSSSNLPTFFHEAFPQLVYLRNLSQDSQPWIQSWVQRKIDNLSIYHANS